MSGEARMWARRLRKVGFSPVTLHYDATGTVTWGPSCWYLRCNWPYDLAALPLNLYPYFAHRDDDDYDGTYEYWSAVRLVLGRGAAQALLASFREVRLGMGSRPLPPVERDPWEPPCVPAGRLRWDRDDWPREGWRHPDYIP